MAVPAWEILVSVTLGQLTTTSVDEPELPPAALPTPKVALLRTVPQVVVEVVEVMWTWTEAPEACSSGAQLSVLVDTLSLHDALPILVATTFQLSPVVGRVSAMVTAWATPGP